METTIYFGILATIAVVSGFLTITRQHPLSATISMVVTLISLAGLYALLSAHFLFIIQILVYAGAIMALMVFVIMLLNIRTNNLPPEPNILRNVLLTLLLLSPIFFVLRQALQTNFSNQPFLQTEPGYGTIKQVGMHLYTSYYFPFEMVSILLLVALIGVVTLAKRRI